MKRQETITLKTDIKESPMKRKPSIVSMSPSNPLEPLPNFFQDLHILFFGIDKQKVKQLQR